MMTSHELARLLLTGPDLPVATHALGHTYACGFHSQSHGRMKVGVLVRGYAEDDPYRRTDDKPPRGHHIVIGDISRTHINYPNEWVIEMLHGRVVKGRDYYGGEYLEPPISATPEPEPAAEHDTPQPRFPGR